MTPGMHHMTNKITECIHHAFLMTTQMLSGLPDLSIDKQLCKKNIDFLEQIKARIKSEEELSHYTALMFQTFSSIHYRDNFLFCISWKDLLSLFDLNKSVYFIIIKLLVQFSLKSRLHFPASILLSYLQRYRLRNIWHTFINYTKEHKLYHEQGILEEFPFRNT